MKDYKIIVSAAPHSHSEWFSGQHLVETVQGENLNDAQEKLDIWCRSHGTDNDAYFWAHGPSAIPPVAYKYADPLEDSRYIHDEAEAQEIADDDPALIKWLPEE